MAYVSITGLRLKRWYHAPRFWWHALSSMQQALRDPACRLAIAKQIDGVHHTITLWDDAKSMRAFMMAGAHRKAMRAFPHIGTGFGFGFEAVAAPSWQEAHRLWQMRDPSSR